MIKLHECQYLAGSCCGDGPFCTCPKPVLKCKCGSTKQSGEGK